MFFIDSASSLIGKNKIQTLSGSENIRHCREESVTRCYNIKQISSFDRVYMIERYSRQAAVILRFYVGSDCHKNGSFRQTCGAGK